MQLPITWARLKYLALTLVAYWVNPFGLAKCSVDKPLDWGGTDLKGLSCKGYVRRHGVSTPQVEI